MSKHLRDSAPNVEKYKVLQMFFMSINLFLELKLLWKFEAKKLAKHIIIIESIITAHFEMDSFSL